MTEVASNEFDGLLDYLKRTRGFEFNAYKRASLMRRMEKRMQAVGVEGFANYTDFLEVHPEEFALLFNGVLINVTAFFRDEAPWEFIRDSVLPDIITTDPAQPVRIWSAGCASGEEPYSMAILLAEAMGREQFRDRVKIYATDIDDHALNQARAAAYSEKQVSAVPAPLLEKYFVQDGDRYVFDKEMRRSVILGRHDLIQDAPISRVNVILCRNALMYFNTEAQSRMLTRFHFALGERGVLFLGKAEMLLTHAHLFAPIDLRRRIFRKVSTENWRDRFGGVPRGGNDDRSDRPQDRRLYSGAFDASQTPQFVLDPNGLLAVYNERARTLFNFAPSDIGRPFQDLEVSFKPVELRSVVTRALEDRHTIALREIAWPAAGRETRFVDVHVGPINDGDGRPAGVSVSFIDVSRIQDLQSQLNRSRQDLETAYEELQSTNEELETTNEELQSTVEELETTNEELQSTNEELETMNEELQSTNEELQTVNEELRQLSDDYNRANGFLESILAGVRSGVVVVDRELHVTTWNHRAEDLWGLREDEAKEQNLLNLDIGLPTEQLKQGIRACLSGDSDVSEMIVDATNRRGRSIKCKVIATPLLGAGRENRGAILLMDEVPLVH